MAVERAMREGALEQAELQYDLIRASEEKVAQAEAMEAANMVEESVTSEHIANVVSRWTGVPVDKMLQGEREKLLAMEDALRGRVIARRKRWLLFLMPCADLMPVCRIRTIISFLFPVPQVLGRRN